MGCWNETDMISRLPIMGGDPVCAVILAAKPDRIDTTRPDGSWFPAGAPVMGTYDEYGNLEDIKADLDACTALDRLRPFWLDADGIRHDIRLDYTPNGVHEYLAAIHDHDCYIRYEDARGDVVEARICIVFIHRRFLALAKEAYQREPWEDRDTPLAIRELESYMRRLRIAWGPTCGTGSQAGIDSPEQLLFYRIMLSRAEELYRDSVTAREDN